MAQKPEINVLLYVASALVLAGLVFMRRLSLFLDSVKSLLHFFAEELHMSD